MSGGQRTADRGRTQGGGTGRLARGKSLIGNDYGIFNEETGFKGMIEHVLQTAVSKPPSTNCWLPELSKKFRY